MTNTPQKIDKDVLQEKISCLLETNGTMPETQRNQLTTYLMLDMREDIKTLMLLVARVQKLETTNIVMWIKRNPKIAATIVWALFISSTLWFIFVHDILPWLVNNLKTLSELRI
jgi:hypothetical protein